jgi:transposase
VVARRYDINLLFKWKREAEAGQLGGALATAAVAGLVPLGVVGRGPDGAPTLLARIPGDENGLRPREPCRSAELAAAAALTGGVIEIDLPCGTRVRVDAAVDARALGRLLGALKRHSARADQTLRVAGCGRQTCSGRSFLIKLYRLRIVRRTTSRQEGANGLDRALAPREPRWG